VKEDVNLSPDGTPILGGFDEWEPRARSEWLRARVATWRPNLWPALVFWLAAATAWLVLGCAPIKECERACAWRGGLSTYDASWPATRPCGCADGSWRSGG